MSHDELRERLQQTRPLTAGGESSVLHNPWCDDLVGYNGGRVHKPHGREEGLYLSTPLLHCPFCSFLHPPNVMACFDGRWRVSQEQESVRIGGEWVAKNGHPTAQNIKELFSLFPRFNALGAPECRLFHNAFPSGRLGPLRVTDCLVVVTNQIGHGADPCDCPMETVTAVFESFKIVGEYAGEYGLTPVPGTNGGRQRISGPSIDCAHSQIWLAEGVPPLYERMKNRRDKLGYCPLCAMVRQSDLQIPVNGLKALRLMAHPAPERSWSLVIAPVECIDSLGQIDSAEWAVAFLFGLHGLRRKLGALPAYNFFVRIGAGHVHAEIMPRNTNIPGAVEKATRLATVDVAPAVVRSELAEALSL
jgi:hypothetical protein